MLRAALTAFGTFDEAEDAGQPSFLKEPFPFDATKSIAFPLRTLSSAFLLTLHKKRRYKRQDEKDEDTNLKYYAKNKPKKTITKYKNAIQHTGLNI